MIHLWHPMCQRWHWLKDEESRKDEAWEKFHTYVSVNTHAHTRTHTHLNTCTWTPMHALEHMCTYMYLNTHVHTHGCARTHVHARTVTLQLPAGFLERSHWQAGGNKKKKNKTLQWSMPYKSWPLGLCLCTRCSLGCGVEERDLGDKFTGHRQTPLRSVAPVGFLSLDSETQRASGG